MDPAQRRKRVEGQFVIVLNRRSTRLARGLLDYEATSASVISCAVVRNIPK